MKRVLGFLRFVLVTIGIIVLTSLSIDATNVFQQSQSALSIVADRFTASDCPEGMVKVALGSTQAICVDVYEVSPASACSYAAPTDAAYSAINLNEPACLPASVPEKLPWTHVAYVQAEQLCAKAGKRLPTAAEWYAAARGTPDTATVCSLNEALSSTGAHGECRSGAGAFDLVGNVWEWVAGETVDGQFDGRVLPPAGYVAAVDDAGLAVETTVTPQLVYNDDYFWSRPDGRYRLLRGGFHGSKSDGGMYSVHAHTADNFSSAAIGFRCVKDL